MFSVVDSKKVGKEGLRIIEGKEGRVPWVGKEKGVYSIENTICNGYSLKTRYQDLLNLFLGRAQDFL